MPARAKPDRREEGKKMGKSNRSRNGGNAQRGARGEAAETARPVPHAEARRLIGALNASFRRCPKVFSLPQGLSAEEACAASEENSRRFDEWRRDDWTPAEAALKAAGVKYKYDAYAGRYFLKYTAGGLENFAVRVEKREAYSLFLAAKDAAEADRRACEMVAAVERGEAKPLRAKHIRGTEIEIPVDWINGE